MSGEAVSGISVDQKKRDARWVLMWVVGFFATFIAVDVYMVTVAVTTQTGTVVDQPYERGLAYTQVIAAAERQRAMGWVGNLVVLSGQVQFTVQDKHKRPVTGATGQVSFFRPVQAGFDFTVPLREVSPGVYRADVDRAVTGFWQVRAYIKRGADTFAQDQEFNL